MIQFAGPQRFPANIYKILTEEKLLLKGLLEKKCLKTAKSAQTPVTGPRLLPLSQESFPNHITFLFDIYCLENTLIRYFIGRVWGKKLSYNDRYDFKLSF